MNFTNTIKLEGDVKKKLAFCHFFFHNLRGRSHQIYMHILRENSLKSLLSLEFIDPVNIFVNKSDSNYFFYKNGKRTYLVNTKDIEFLSIQIEKLLLDFYNTNTYINN
jgi:hypothetical protein